MKAAVFVEPEKMEVREVARPGAGRPARLCATRLC